MDYSSGLRKGCVCVCVCVGGGGLMSHEFEPLYSFVEIIFSLMRVFSKYLTWINPL